DDSARKIKMYSTFGNNAAPSTTGEPVPTTDLCKVTQYDYTLTYDPGQSDDDGVADDGNVNPWMIRRTIVQVPLSGTLREISRQYRHVYASEFWETQECPTPGALWGASGNLRSITVVNTDGKPLAVSHSDWTATLYSYSSDYSNTIM